MNWCGEENLVLNKKDNRVFMSWNYWSGSCPLEMQCSLNKHICPWRFASQANNCFKEHQISMGQLLADSSSTETLYCLISVQWLYMYVVIKNCNVSSFLWSIERQLRNRWMIKVPRRLKGGHLPFLETKKLLYNVNK